MDRRALKKMIFVHLALVVGVLLYPLYVWAAKQITAVIPGCILHDWFSVYCALCGGTRALGALLRLELSEALKMNAYVVLLFFTAVVYDVIAWRRLFRGETVLLSVSKPVWTIYFVLLVVYWILRNVLMIAFGIDPLGDLVWFWNEI